MKPLNKKRGFTLIELLIAMALSGIIISAIYSLFISQNKSYTIQEQVAEMQQNARVGMEWMVREIRMAGYDPTGNAGAGIVAATSDSIQFTADLNDDGDTEDSNENITYSLYDSGGDGDLDLGRRSGGGSNQPVAENIPGLTFSYFDESGNETTDPSQIRKVEITLTAQTDKPDPDYPDNNGHRQRDLTSMVIVRNLQEGI